jgi:hypothetical protein
MAQPTDRRHVSDAGHLNHSGLDDAIAALPSACIVAHQGEARLVIGPSGAFVLLATHGDRVTIEATAHRLADLVLTTRNALCDHLTWVPFVDALLVTSADAPHDVDVTVVPGDLVHDVLIEGPTVITLGTLNAIRETLRTGRLDGWQVGSPSSSAAINLRDPARPTTSR